MALVSIGVLTEWNSCISCEKFNRNVPIVIHLSWIHFEFLWLLIGLQAAQEILESSAETHFSCKDVACIAMHITEWAIFVL